MKFCEKKFGMVFNKLALDNTLFSKSNMCRTHLGFGDFILGSSQDSLIKNRYLRWR